MKITDQLFNACNGWLNAESEILRKFVADGNRKSLRYGNTAYWGG
jgi:hypothetical protein